MILLLLICQILFCTEIYLLNFLHIYVVLYIILDIICLLVQYYFTFGGLQKIRCLQIGVKMGFEPRTLIRCLLRLQHII
jgi:hypothetical protein